MGGDKVHLMARNLRITKKPRRIAIIGLGIVVILATSIFVTIMETSRNCPASRLYVCTYVFKPAPKNLLANGEIEFKRLSESDISKVRITPEQARRIADAPYGRNHKSRIVFESLGGYIDKNDSVKDWVGTRSWIPKAVPAYIVRISGLEIPSSGPGPLVSDNQLENVIVNAETGKIIAGFTYD
jgi:hypothetical protein